MGLMSLMGLMAYETFVFLFPCFLGRSLNGLSFLTTGVGQRTNTAEADI